MREWSCKICGKYNGSIVNEPSDICLQCQRNILLLSRGDRVEQQTAAVNIVAELFDDVTVDVQASNVSVRLAPDTFFKTFPDYEFCPVDAGPYRWAWKEEGDTLGWAIYKDGNVTFKTYTSMKEIERRENDQSETGKELV